MKHAALDYSVKEDAYFSAPRADIVALMPDRADVLEVGCGSGATGALAFEQGKAKTYVGIELEHDAAALARLVLSDVLVGDVECMDLSDLGRFDVLIMSEVLEHLTDPWDTLKRLGAHVKPGGMLYCSSPNIASKAIIKALLGGRFEYEPSGMMDVTHLRWFTPASFCRMVEEAGFRVLTCGPVAPVTPKWKLFNRLTGNRFAHLGMNQIFVTAQKR